VKFIFSTTERKVQICVSEKKAQSGTFLLSERQNMKNARSVTMATVIKHTVGVQSTYKAFA
jgi:hypothetical protein